MTLKDMNRPVGRPRKFDEEAVLEAAMDAFWLKGYEATSLSDLCCCTGLHKGSLYQAFGDKHQLFMQALTHYAEKEFQEVVKVASQVNTPLGRIKAAVSKICTDAGQEKGCLLVNSMVELAPHDPQVKAAVKSFADKRLHAMAGLIAEAQQAAEIRAGLDPYKLARQLMMALVGGAAMVKGFMENDELVQAIDELIDSWT